MRFLYNILVYLASFILRVIAVFSPKINFFVKGRKNVFSKLKKEVDDEKPLVWIHAASLGEFEQGRPVIEEIKKRYATHQIVLTFFSPSGYEVRKNYNLADVVCYLPLDTSKNAREFLEILKPSAAIFIKYEFWPNYLYELATKEIPVYLISGIFRENQVFFKPHGFWMRKHLRTIQHFFVQDKQSQELLKSIGVGKVTIAGDTRFDRVQKLVEANEKLPFVEEFKNEHYLVVAGSTWPEDEQKLVAYINSKATDIEKFIIVPHNIKPVEIEKLKNSIVKSAVLFSEKEGVELGKYQVMIVDTIGVLSKIYAYANVAYIGGGYTKSGVHNTLEAATYGLPIVIGPNFVKFKEVQDLVALEGCVVTTNDTDLGEFLESIFHDESLRVKKAEITKMYVQQNLGATQKIINCLREVLS